MTFLAAQAIFYYMAAASVVSAALAVTRKNPVHSMLWVLSLFMHVAGIFLLLSAEFLAAVQIIVYAGAILIFYLFVLMLLDLPGEEARPRFGRHWPVAVVGAVGLVILVWVAQMASLTQNQTLKSTQVEVASASAPSVTEDPSLGSLSDVGTALFGPFALPFELASLVLLAAIVGAVVLARRKAGS
jgi:NADH-quinone oxidoreductase subunit J